METQIRHSPSFAITRITLAGGEKIRVEGGAMAAHSAGVTMEAKAEGGLLKGLSRKLLAGESFFITSYTAPAEGGWVDVAARLPGDAFVFELNGTKILTSGSFVAAESSVTIETKWGGMGNLLGGEGGWGIRASGTGTLVIACYGALDTIDLAAGETIIVDSGHLVAWDETITMANKAAGGKFLTAMKSGEDLVYQMTGPGQIMTQSRNPNEFVSWLIPQLPTQRA